MKSNGIRIPADPQKAKGTRSTVEGETRRMKEPGEVRVRLITHLGVTIHAGSGPGENHLMPSSNQYSSEKLKQ